jgi:hypothetical protein
VSNGQDLWIDLGHAAVSTGGVDCLSFCSFDEFAVDERGAGADKRDEVGCVNHRQRS